MSNPVQDSEEPDFKFRVIRTGKAFWVEAKYLSRYYENKVECYKPYQLKRYKEIDNKCPVYITLGLGGEPDSQDQVFLYLSRIFNIHIQNYFFRS